MCELGVIKGVVQERLVRRLEIVDNLYVTRLIKSSLPILTRIPVFDGASFEGPEVSEAEESNRFVTPIASMMNSNVTCEASTQENDLLDVLFLDDMPTEEIYTDLRGSNL